jgi:hypothetical protein
MVDNGGGTTTTIQGAETSINRMLKHSEPLAQVFVEYCEVTVTTWIV